MGGKRGQTKGSAKLGQGVGALKREAETPLQTSSVNKCFSH